MSPGTVFSIAIPFIVVALSMALIYTAWWLPFPPDPYDSAIVIRICYDGSRVFRMEDGSFRTVRAGAFRGYRVENPKEVC